MNKDSIVLDVLKAIAEGGEEPRYSDYGLNDSEFGDIIEDMRDRGLIEYAMVLRGGVANPVVVTYLKHANLTNKGRLYLAMHKGN